MYDCHGYICQNMNVSVEKYNSCSKLTVWYQQDKRNLFSHILQHSIKKYYLYISLLSYKNQLPLKYKVSLKSVDLYASQQMERQTVIVLQTLELYLRLQLYHLIHVRLQTTIIYHVELFL